jgi:hypothetical protein
MRQKVNPKHVLTMKQIFCIQFLLHWVTLLRPLRSNPNLETLQVNKIHERKLKLAAAFNLYLACSKSTYTTALFILAVQNSL